MNKNILKKRANTSGWEKQNPESVIADIKRIMATWLPNSKRFYYKRTTVGVITEIEINIKIFKYEFFIKFIKIGCQGHLTIGVH